MNISASKHKTFKQLVLESIKELEVTIFCPAFNKLTPELQDDVKRGFAFHYGFIEQRGLCKHFSIDHNKHMVEHSKAQYIENEETGPKFIITNIRADSQHLLGLEGVIGKMLDGLIFTLTKAGRGNIRKYIEDVRDNDKYRKKISIDYQSYRILGFTVKDKYEFITKTLPELEGMF